MTIRYLVLSTAIATICASATPPAQAFTHHPATPEEIQQTDALNSQSLANAQGAATDRMSAALAMPSASMTMNLPSLSDMAVPPPALETAAVRSQAGETVGFVQKVLTGTDGKVSIVDVTLAGNKKVVAISASELSYDAQRNVLMTSLTGEQIKSLPEANS
ncbi:MAG: hypothetical protein ACXWBP_06630 [Limisphaerales bacterium]